MIRAYLSTAFREWDKHIPLKAMSLHSEKMFDRLLSQYAHVGQGNQSHVGIQNNSPQSLSGWVASLSERLSTAHQSAREAIDLEQFRQRRNYDLRVLENSCGVGDVVYLRDTSTKVGVHSKLRPPFIGPYLVIKAHPPLYMIEGKKKTKTIYHDRLKVV